CVINLLDTPGHEDFSEDTYRVLMAVDAAVMVIDAAKGVETQTRKLFEVCRMRGVPIFTFINKCDRPGRDPLALLDEIEEVLGMGVSPVNWPLGLGRDFHGLVGCADRGVLLYARSGKQRKADETRLTLDDPGLRQRLGPATVDHVEEQLALLEAAAHPLDWGAIRASRTTPIYFGSALTDFGVRWLLDAFVSHAPAPQPRLSAGTPLDPVEAPFAGFVFKIQANMDPRHRDRVAFIRICAGHFERDMSVLHTRTGKTLRLAFSHRLFGRERETADEAWAGDVVGISGPRDLQLGDTLSVEPGHTFAEMPRFAPEAFIYLHNPDTQNMKRFRAGLDQLLQEQLVQRFFLENSPQGMPLLGAVGALQFDVVQARLELEYRTPTRREPAPWEAVRWIRPEDLERARAALPTLTGTALARDLYDAPVLLFPSEWSVGYFAGRHPQIPLATANKEVSGQGVIP
ncbi:MAG: peptide chain release factor 3, partial [Verrucomicrobiota bacterium]